MARIEKWYNQDLNEIVKVRYLDGNIFSADNYGNVIGVKTFKGGSPYGLSGVVSASIIRADGATVPVAGSLDYNSAYIAIPQTACLIPGPISIVVKLTNGGDITTLLAVVGFVYQSATDSAIDPGTIIPSISTLIAAIDNAVESIPLDYSALVSAVTKGIGVYCKEFNMEANTPHSSTLDKLYIPVNGNEKIRFVVLTSNGNNVAGSIVFWSALGENVGEAGFTTNIERSVVAEYNAVSMGAYIPSMNTSATVTIIAYRESSVVQKVDDYANEIHNALDYGVKIFTLFGGHSANDDRLSFPVLANKPFIVHVVATNGAAISGAVTFKKSDGTAIGDSYAITTGTPRKIVLTENLATTGVYLPAQSSATTVYLRVIPADSLLYGGTDIVDIFKSDMDAAIQGVALKQTYTHGVSFTLISDIHWETNWQHSPKLVDYIADHSRLKTVINCGDNASGSNDVNDQVKWLYDCTSAFTGNYDFYSVIGNHDNNSVTSSGAIIPSAELRNLMLPSVDAVTYGPGNYYHFAKDGTRFICLDTGTNGNSDSTQINWVKSVIESAAEDYIVIIMHIVYVSNSASDPCPLFSDLISMIGTLASGDKAKIQAIFGGHQHSDHNYTFDNIPVVLVDTDSRFADDGIPRVDKTTTAQCFDLVVVNYDERKIYTFRIGTIGTDRTISY